MSIYREEGVETLIEALWQKDFSNTQMKALDALLFLIGHVTLSGKSYTKVWLLKIVGFDQPYNALIKAKRLGQYGNDSMEIMLYTLSMSSIQSNTKLETINVSVAQQELRAYAKSIYKIMRKLIKYSTIVVDIMKTLLNLNSIDVVSTK
ncbi:hypothetical protein JHK82_034203 [Glycine max]|nr:hypothetical protein JHK85_034917 [Glycine max]KAG4986581.1 hypothetical protein JHK86_034272 [Glycine max]KAG5119783.1 hypothetical protein JHK82_034203 [Glycine max]KAG5140775.1 hypothetical protein JHK84_034543 [Glycine max]